MSVNKNAICCIKSKNTNEISFFGKKKSKCQFQAIGLTICLITFHIKPYYMKKKMNCVNCVKRVSYDNVNK